MICQEKHTVDSLSWLRASLLGANDGLLSTSSLMMGVIQTKPSMESLIIIGIASVIAGSFAMATGEYVSVSSQRDIERENIAKEKHELETNWEHEVEELQAIYVQRGLTQELALEVARQMMQHNALEAHLRDELGINEIIESNPLQASIASGISFISGAIIPILTAIAFLSFHATIILFFTTVISLILLGLFSAKVGGTDYKKSITRVLLFGTISMILTYCLGVTH